MSSAPRRTSLPPLAPGQRLTQPEFHRRYEMYPEDVKFELIGGVVYVASPLRWRHGNYDSLLGTVLGLYVIDTPGIESAHNATMILGGRSEPQPDQTLRILPEYGGHSRLTPDGYVEGAPEFFAEIAYSSRDIDLGGKRQDYQRAGVLEYLVACIAEQELHWFHFPSDRPIRPTRQGVWKSRVFPGLWVDGPGLLARDMRRLAEAVRAGLASRGHAAFVKRLEAARRKSSRG